MADPDVPAGRGVVQWQGLAQWQGLVRCSGWAALGSVVLIIVQVAVFIVWPPVDTGAEVFALMDRAPALGLVTLDLAYLINNLLVWLFYLGLGVALWPVSRSIVVLAVGLGTMQMAAYVSSNPALEMLTLSQAYRAADPGARLVLEAAGEAVLASWKGTAFVVYYLLGAVVLFLFAWLLRHSALFPPSTWRWALAAGVLMTVPSTFGTVGLVLSLASLIPWCILCVIAGRRLLGLAARDLS